MKGEKIMRMKIKIVRWEGNQVMWKRRINFDHWTRTIFFRVKIIKKRIKKIKKVFCHKEKKRFIEFLKIIFLESSINCWI